VTTARELRARSGVRAWLAARRNEEALVHQVRGALESLAYDTAFA